MIELNKIYCEDCLDTMSRIPDNFIDCCVTSPPYYGLRDYGTAKWVGGNNNCSHRRDSKKSDKTITGHKNFDEMLGVGDAIYKDVCLKCGAKRIDEQIGLEETPELYVQKLVDVFREIKRVLKQEGTLWLNLGDSYNGSGGPGSQYDNKSAKSFKGEFKKYDNPNRKINGLKPKDLIGIPWMVAFALRADGWYLRQDIIWSKPNPMPESVKDRCTKSHEYIFLLSKSQKYYYDQNAIKEPLADMNRTNFQSGSRLNGKNKDRNDNDLSERSKDVVYDDRNKRSVWIVNTKPYKEAHFATFPEDLIIPCIKAGCPEGGTVCDPFMGAGTTALVSHKLNRKFIGSEISAEYCKIAEKRIEPYLMQQKLF